MQFTVSWKDLKEHKEAQGQVKLDLAQLQGLEQEWHMVKICQE